MKKILNIILTLFLALSLNSYAATNWTTQSGVDKVNTIGKNLLAKNNLPTKISFKVIETDEVNAFANADKEICVYTGLLKFVDNDAELAAVIAHEIGHIVNSHVAKQNVINVLNQTLIYSSNASAGLKTVAYGANNLSMLKMSRSQEYEADITGADLIARAGYNPLAMVSVLYKIGGSYADFISTHPSGDKRTMYIYDYISYVYPDKTKAGYNTDSYEKFMIFAKPTIDKRTSNPRKLAAFNKKEAKLKAKRDKKLEKYKTASDNSGWDRTFNAIRAFSSEQ